MNMLDLMNKLTQLSEATKEVPGGKIHTADAGGYGRKEDEPEAGEKKKKVAPADGEKRGRGRPAKGSDTGGGAKPDWSAFGSTGKDVKLPKYDKSKTTKHSLKDWIEHYEVEALNEAEQIQIKPASQMPRLPGQAAPSTPVAGQPAKNTQVIAQGNKTLGTVDNPQLAQQIKQSIGKGEMTLMPGEEMAEGALDEKWDTATKVSPEEKGKYAGKSKQELVKSYNALKASGPHHKGTPEFGRMRELAFAIRAKSGWGKVQDESESMSEGKKPSAGLSAKEKSAVVKKAKAGEDIGKPGKSFEKVEKAAAKGGAKEPKAVAAAAMWKGEAAKKKNVKEGDMPVTTSGTLSPISEGSGNTTLSAHHRGKSHALAREGYNCKYDEGSDEAKNYHDGYKEGLDECYGYDSSSIMPMRGVIGEEPKSEIISTMDRHAEEMNPFTSMAFESLDSQLNALLDEGMTVSISKGQQGAPDSVSITAQDSEADQLLSIMKQSGLGLFGGDDASSPLHAGAVGSNMPSTGGEEGVVDVEVVDDHDDMLSLIRKMTGQGPAQASSDYADEEGAEEEHAEHGEESCDTCGASDCECDDEEMVEDETEDQREFEVSEEADEITDEGNAFSGAVAKAKSDNIPDKGQKFQVGGKTYPVKEEDENGDDAEEQSEVSSDATRDAGLAAAAGGTAPSPNQPEEQEEELEEAYANGADDTFDADIDFMTNVITGGLNKRKVTGQATTPVVATQLSRLGNPMKESTDLLSDWKKLSGLK